MYLTRCGYIHQIVGLNLDLITRRQESVKTHDEVWVALKELRHTVNDSRSVDAAETESMTPYYLTKLININSECEFETQKYYCFWFFVCFCFFQNQLMKTKLTSGI